MPCGMNAADSLVGEAWVVDRDDVELLVEAVFDGRGDAGVGASHQLPEVVEGLCAP